MYLQLRKLESVRDDQERVEVKIRSNIKALS